MIQNMKKLFFDAFRGKKLIMSIVSIVILVCFGGFAIYEWTKTNVNLVLDGEETFLKTHATTVDELMLENDILVGEHDFIEPSLETKLTNEMNVVWIPAIQVKLLNNGNTQSVWTTKKTVEQLFAELDITVGDFDKVEPVLTASLVENMDIIYESAFAVTLQSDGEEKEVWTTSTTVADFLKKENVILGELDRVEPTQDQFVKANSEINVIRVEKVTDVVEEKIDFATVTKKDNGLTKGTEKVINPGKKGTIAKHYAVVLENGVEVSRELVRTETVKPSEDRVVAVGTKQVVQQVSRAASPGEWLTFQSTAYTANCSGCSGVTSTGFNLKANPNAKVVAVDPKVIPLGSLVEIKVNGKVIGQYRAADKGRAIVGRKIDIFMADRSSALNWGRRIVQVRIVK